MKDDPWICEICAQGFKNEVDLLAHQFNSACEQDMEKRYNKADNQALEPTAKGSANTRIKGGGSV